MTIIDAPSGYAPLENDIPWDPGYLELVSPEQVLMLDELGPEAAGPTALSPVAITSPFRYLTHFAEEGASFSRSHEELQADLRTCIAVVEEAIEEFDREDQGGLLTLGEGE
jgi:hypothetical protein